MKHKVKDIKKVYSKVINVRRSRISKSKIVPKVNKLVENSVVHSHNGVYVVTQSSAMTVALKELSMEALMN